MDKLWYMSKREKTRSFFIEDAAQRKRELSAFVFEQRIVLCINVIADLVRAADVELWTSKRIEELRYEVLNASADHL